MAEASSEVQVKEQEKFQHAGKETWRDTEKQKAFFNKQTKYLLIPVKKTSSTQKNEVSFLNASTDFVAILMLRMNALPEQ